MTPEERAREILSCLPTSERAKIFWDVVVTIRDAEARSYRAAQEQAAEVAENMDDIWAYFGDYQYAVPPSQTEVAAAIRAMKPKETTDE